MKKVTFFMMFLLFGTLMTHSQVFNGGTALAIPDDNCDVTNEFTVTVTGVGTLGTINELDNVAIDITHTWNSDLDITLIAPGGSPTLDLSSGNGGSDDNYTGTIFSDSGATSITAGSAPFTGTFQPEGGSLTGTFDGVAADGDWTLRVCDTATGDTGTINSWSIEFIAIPTTAPPCPATFTSTPDPACGNFDSTISWDASPGADGYLLSVGTSSGATDVVALTDIGNVTSFVVPNQNVSSTYFWNLTPYNGFGTTPCTEQSYSTVATGCYCPAIPTSNDNSGITNVRLQTTDFPTGDVTYFDHSGTAVPFFQGVPGTVEIDFATGFTYSVNIWIDFNDDFVFDPSEKVFGTGLSPATNPNTYDASFTMPGTAPVGVHKMRIGTADNDTLDDPCYNGSFGVYLDFDVDVQVPSCTPATLAGTPTVITDCVGGTFDISVDVTAVGTAAALLDSDFTYFEDLQAGGPGVYVLGPYPIDTPVQLDIVDQFGDPTCSFTVGTFVNDTCPPPAPNGVTCTGPGPVVVYTEEFDSQGVWTGDFGTGNGQWDFDPDETASGSTGPSGPFSGSAYMHYEASGNSTATASAVSPAINLTTAAEAIELAFYMHAYGAVMGTLNVGVSTTGPGGPFTTEFTWTGEFQTDELDPWVPVGVDLTAYIGNTIHLEFSHTGAGGDFTGDMSIDLLTVTACGSFCLDPSAIAVSNIAGTSADIAWTDNAGATDYEVAVQLAGTGEPAAADGSGADTTSNPYTATGLTGNTDYEVYVRAECTAGTEFSQWVGPINFTTLCTPLVPDYTADMSVNVPDACWSEAADGEVADGPVSIGSSDWRQGTSYAVGSSNAINLFSVGDREWLISPEFDLSAGGYQLELNVAVTNWNDGFTADAMGSDDVVQLLVTEDGGSSWTSIDQWNTGNEPPVGGEENVYDLSAYTGTTQFAIWASDGLVDDLNDYDFHVGKFVVRTPPACAEPSGLTLSNITSSSVDASWTGGAGNTAYELYVVPAGDPAPAAGGTPDGSTTDPVVTEGLSTFNGGTPLEAGTVYDVYLYGDCGGVYSNVVGPATFATSPNAPAGVTCTTGSAAFIYSESFEDTSAWTGDLNIAGDGDWEDGDAGSGGTGPDSAHEGSQFSFVAYEASSNESTIASLVSPAIDLTTGNDEAELSFYVHAFGDDIGTLNVGISTAGAGGPFTNVFTWVGPEQTAATDPWTAVGVDISAFLGNTINIEFSYGGTGGGFEGDLAIDFVRVETCGDFCLPVTGITADNITGTTADINWTPTSGETDWEVAVQPIGTGEPAAADGSGADASSIPFTATGLTPLTSYEVWVRAECTAGTEFSAWSGPFNFATTELCPTVSDITISTITDTGATIGWTNGGGTNETSWEVAIQAPGTGTPAGAGDPAPANPYTASGLTAETTYEVYVRADCGVSDGQSTWAGPVNFTTACAAEVPDYLEDFTTFLNPCWTEANGGDLVAGPLNVGSGGWVADGFNNSGTTGATKINFFGSGPDVDWLISPFIDLSAGGYELRFNASLVDWNGTTLTDTLDPGDVIGVYYSADGFTNWVPLYDYIASTPTGDVVTIDISGLTSSSARFAVFTDEDPADTGRDLDVFIDNFEVRTPPACLEISAPTVTNITATSADIGWTNGDPGDTNWEVAVQLAGTGEPAAADGSGADTATNPYAATGLTPETDYEVWIRTECVAGTEFSPWTGPINFSTPCVTFVPDYLEDFSTFLDSCWDEATGGDLVAGPASIGSGAWTNDSFNNSGGTSGATKINFFGGGPDVDWLISPTFDLSAGGYELRFDASVVDWNGTVLTDTFNAGDVIGMYYSADGSTNWTPVYDYIANTPDGSATVTIDISGLTSSTARFAMFTDEDPVNTTFRDLDVFLDNFEVRTPPSCLEVTAVNVTNITANSADIGWTDSPSGETNWEVAVQLAGTGEPAAADGSGADTATNPYTATGLTAETDYEVWVRAECTAGTDFSSWVGPVNFSTPCEIFVPNYAEDFTTFLDSCWSEANGGDLTAGPASVGTGGWVADGFNNSGTTGAAKLNMFGTGPDVDWLITPFFDLSAGGYELRFNGTIIDWNGTVLTDTLNPLDVIGLYYSTDGTNWVQLYDMAAGLPSGEVISVDISGLTSTTQFAFFTSEDTSNTTSRDIDIMIDNFVITDNAPITYTFTSGVWAPTNPSGLATVNDDIVIVSGDATIGSSTTCNSLTINPGAGLTVASGVTLDVSTVLTCQSTSTSYSSLLRDGTINGPIVYERHVNINGSGTTGSNDLVSAPLTGQSFNAFASANPNIFNDGGAPTTLYLFGPFDKPSGLFLTWDSNETATLDASVGYRAASNDNSTLSFTGTAENGIVTNDITNSGPTNQKWNLIGNPYPSHLNVWDFLLHNVGGATNLDLFDATTAAIWGYDGSAINGWTIYNLATTTPSTVITPGQGFFVSADPTNEPLYDVEFTPGMRRTGNTDDFIVGRNASLTFLKLKLSSSSNNYMTEFYFNSGSSQGFDRGYDAAHWGDTLPDFSMYSSLVDGDQGDKIVLQSLNSTDLADVTIPLGVNANQGEQITFSIDDSTLPSTVSVYLDDVVANTTTLLNDGDYVITPTTDLSGTGRFFLRYSDDTLSTIDNSLDALDIFSLKGSDELVVNGQLFDDTTLDLFDIQGRKVLSTELDTALIQNRIDVATLSAGVYIVTVRNNSQELTKKVIIE